MKEQDNPFEENNAPTETVQGESEETNTGGLPEDTQGETTDSSEETESTVEEPVEAKEKPVAHYLGNKNGKPLYQWEDMRFHAEDCPDDCVMEAIPMIGSKKR